MKKHLMVRVLSFLFIYGFILFPLNVFAISTPNDSDTFAKDNNLHLLKKDEYAIVLTGDNALKSDEKKVIITLKNGDFIPLTIPAGTVSFNVISYEEGHNQYLPNNNPSIKINNISDFTGFDETNKIDTAIERKLKEDQLVPVIIKLNISKNSQFNNQTQDKSQINIQNNNNNFNIAREAVLADINFISKNSKIGINNQAEEDLHVTDLPIVDSISLKINKDSIDNLKKNPYVSKIKLDRRVYATLDTSLDDINAYIAWQKLDPSSNLITGTGMRIAIIDTGVDYTKPALGGCFGTSCKVIDGYDFVNYDSDPMDDMGHGTHVAATAAGNENVFPYLKGVAPDAKILAYKVLDSNGSGFLSSVISAIQRATDPNNDGDTSDHVDVGNLSLGVGCGPNYSSVCGPNDDVSQAVNASSSAGVIWSISAGNSGSSLSTVGSPGVAASAITVAAANKTSDNPLYPIASFSSRGPVVENGIDYLKPDITAPGVNICATRWSESFSGRSTCFNNQHIRISGTSMAAPHVAGVAALIKQANPNFTPAEVKQRIKNTSHNLGVNVPYNEQGAGEVDLAAAIPDNNLVKSFPSQWNITTVPIQKFSVENNFFSVTTSDSTITSVSVLVGTLPNGVTLTTDKQMLSFGTSGTDSDSFSVSITVDNDIAVAGAYQVFIYFENGVDNKKGVITIPIKISPTIKVSLNNEIDYGNDTPSLATWTSNTVPITFTNLRTDISQTINFSSSTFASGISYQINPNSLTIAADSSSVVETNFIVTNSQVVNGKYYGTFLANNLVNSINIPVKFAKYYTFTFQPGIPEDFNGSIGIALSKTNGEQDYILDVWNKHTGPITINTLYEGPYDAEVTMFYDSPPYNVYKIMFDNLMSGSVSVVNKFDSNRRIKVIPTFPNGTDLSSVKFFLKTYYNKNTTGNGEYGTWLFGEWGDFYVNSSINNKFDLEVSYIAQDDLSANQYIFGGKVEGLSFGNVVFTNTIEDFDKIIIKPKLNIPNGTSISPGFFMNCPFSSICVTFQKPNLRIITPFEKTSYFVSTEDFSDFNLSFISFNPAEDLCIYSDQCSSRFITPGVNLKTKTQKYFGFFNSSIESPIQPLIGDTIYPGLGPVGWFMKFSNNGNEIIGNYVSFTPYRPILRQGFEMQDYSDILYTIKKGNNTLVSDIITGHEAENIGKNQQEFSHQLSADAYKFNASFPYYVLGQTMNGEVEEFFDTSIVDKNPPYLKQISFYTNNIKSQTYNKNYDNKLELGLDPNGGTMSNVDLSYSTDGVTFTPTTIGIVDDIYTAILPTINTTTNILSIRFKAVDDSNNYFQYTFQVPVNNQINLDPVVLITSPLNGDSLNGLVTISANASDDIGIDHVNFYVGESLIGSSITSPYSVSFDSSTVRNGFHALRAEAYDMSGNKAVSYILINIVGSLISDIATVSSNIYTVSANGTINETISDVPKGISRSLFLSNLVKGEAHQTWDTSGFFGVSTILGSTGAKPHDIAIDSNGNIYTSNFNSNNVTKITPEGVSTILGSTGANPHGIAIDSNGNIYTSNINSRNVTKITPDGVSTTFGSTGITPYDVALDSYGNIYTANFNSNNVTKITPEGVSTILGSTGDTPNGIAIDSNGNIYTANFVSRNVTKITPAGVSTVFGLTGIGPAAIKIDSHNNIYTSNFDSNNVSKITQEGVSTILGATGVHPYNIVIDLNDNLYTVNRESSDVSKINLEIITNNILSVTSQDGSNSVAYNIVVTDTLIPISISAINGIVQPETGATPIATIADTAEYTATISWDGNPSTFASETVYTATITLTPKAGYTLSGVPADFFTVEGATATNSANSGVVTVVFPATGANITTPGKVINITASAVSTSGIDLSWTAPANGGSTIIGYKIERATPIGGTMTTLVANTGNTNTTYSDIGLSASTGYSYKVSAINGVGTGLASDISSATTSAVITGGGSSGGGGGNSTPSITKPTVYSITPILTTGITATLKGNISATGGANITSRGFNYGKTINYGKNTIENGTFGTGTFSTNISSLTCGTIYHFQSYATNSVGTSYGPDQTFTTLACGVMPPINPEVKIVPNTNKTNISLDILKISRSLKLGMTGEDVKTLQKYLNTHGYVIAVSGNGSLGNESTYFGQKTKDAVIKFQKANGLVADGAVGKKTRELMAKLDNINIPHVEPISNILPSVPVVSKPVVQNTNIIGSQSLKLGMTGEDVKTLQKYLNTHGYVIAVSGNGSLGNESTYFGQKTKDAVIKFQKANGLVADGAVGKKTRELMANPDIKNSVIENKITPPVKEIVKPVVNTLPKVEVPTTNKYLNKTLKQGMTDSDVVKLQKLLNNFGYTISKTGIGSSGFEGNVFDSLTTKAVKDFQIDNELKADGVVGGQTRNLMNSMWEQSH